MELSNQFHGTRADLHVGDTLHPHDKLGIKANYTGLENHSRGRVFMADTEATAWAWASAGENHHPGGRTNVLRVTPGENFREGPAENTAKTAKVEERIDTKPGRQGTLPINWNQFAKDQRNTLNDSYNHPEDQDVSLGHRLEPYSPHRPMTDGPEPPLSLENLPEPKVQKPDATKQGRLF